MRRELQQSQDEQEPVSKKERKKIFIVLYYKSKTKPNLSLKYLLVL